VKRAVEECLVWNINDLLRTGVFKAPAFTLCDCVWRDASGKETHRFNFRWESNFGTPSLRIFEKEDALSVRGLIIELAMVSCHLGGMKRLFKCPGDGMENLCGRRSQKLYLIDGRWKCRHCGNLTYLARRNHDARKDALLRNPLALLALLRSDDHKKRLLAVGACAQAIARSGKRREITH
jgi:hypothetical protein